MPIYNRRGTKASLPNSAKAGELKLATDTKEVYLSTDANKANDIKLVTTDSDIELLSFNATYQDGDSHSPTTWTRTYTLPNTFSVGQHIIVNAFTNIRCYPDNTSDRGFDGNMTINGVVVSEEAHTQKPALEDSITLVGSAGITVPSNRVISIVVTNNISASSAIVALRRSGSVCVTAINHAIG